MMDMFDAARFAARYGVTTRLDPNRLVFLRGEQEIGSTIITDNMVSRHAVELILGLKD